MGRQGPDPEDLEEGLPGDRAGQATRSARSWRSTSATPRTCSRCSASCSRSTTSPTPKAFYGKEDFWEVPADPTQDAASAFNRGTTRRRGVDGSGDGPAQPPYYVLLQFPGQTGPSFSLTSTFVARGRPNLTAFAAVSSDPGDYGKIRVLQLPKGTVIPGPGLVANQFETNTEVSTKLSLLRSGGSEVVLGNLLTLPVGNGLLYIEPVYTQGKKEPKFPILNS